jgi:hypothetical protein
MYSELSNRQIPPLRISNLQRCWRRGFSNSVPKAARLRPSNSLWNLSAQYSMKEIDRQEYSEYRGYP